MMPRPSRDIDDRLADLDRRLREVQEELLPGREPRPAAPPPARHQEPPPPPHRPPPGPSRPPGLPPGTAPLTELHAKLLGSFRELLDAYEWLLTQTAHASAPPPPGSQTTGVSAGPFADIAAVRAFEAVLGSVPGVRSVTVRGYEGDDRAIFDVEIGGP